MGSEWDKERKFEIEKVSPVYLITALCVVPFGVYFLLNFLSPLVHRITAMKVAAVCAYIGLNDPLLTHEDLRLPYQIITSSQSQRGSGHTIWLQARSYEIHLPILGEIISFQQEHSYLCESRQRALKPWPYPAIQKCRNSFRK
jgi:hypothetical protein